MEMLSSEKLVIPKHCVSLIKELHDIHVYELDFLDDTFMVDSPDDRAFYESSIHDAKQDSNYDDGYDKQFIKRVLRLFSSLHNGSNVARNSPYAGLYVIDAAEFWLLREMIGSKSFYNPLVKEKQADVLRCFDHLLAIHEKYDKSIEYDATKIELAK